MKLRRRRWGRPWSSVCVTFTTVVVVLAVCASFNALMERKGAFLMAASSHTHSSRDGGGSEQRGELRLPTMHDADAAERLTWLRGAHSGEYSRDPRRPRGERVAFLKTHKTGACPPPRHLSSMKVVLQRSGLYLVYVVR